MSVEFGIGVIAGAAIAVVALWRAVGEEVPQMRKMFMITNAPHIPNTVVIATENERLGVVEVRTLDGRDFGHWAWRWIYELVNRGAWSEMPDPEFKYPGPVSNDDERDERAQAEEGLIKECPFCGGRARLMSSRTHPSTSVECSECGANTPGSGKFEELRITATVRWNRRVYEPNNKPKSEEAAGF